MLLSQLGEELTGNVPDSFLLRLFYKLTSSTSHNRDNQTNKEENKPRQTLSPILGATVQCSVHWAGVLLTKTERERDHFNQRTELVRRTEDNY